MRSLRSVFLKGLVAVLPIGLTFYLLWWMASGAEAVAGGIWTWLFPEADYQRGTGLVMGVVFVFLVGLLLHAVLIRRLLDAIEAAMQRIPVVKTIYGAIRDLLDFFTGQGLAERTGTVVEVTFEDGRTGVLGFLTRESLADLGDDERVAVYLPMSFQIGGYTVFVERGRLRQVEVSAEDAVRFAMTAGLSRKDRRKGETSADH